MKILKRTWKYQIVLAMLLLCLSSMTVFAAGDNSLASLGIADAQISPEFVYSTTEYEVKVPAGTEKLEIDPQTSDPNAEITSIEGTELDNGKGTVTISVSADDGSVAVYTLHVSQDEAAAATEAATETVTEASIPQTEDKAAVTQTNNDELTSKLRVQVTGLESKVDLLMKIVYGMIAFAVILLFIIINQLLRNKDLKDDLRDAENELDLNSNEFARKEKSLSTDYYYAPVQEMQPESINAPGVPIEKIQEKTEQAFGNAQAVARPRTRIRKDKHSVEGEVKTELEQPGQQSSSVQSQNQIAPGQQTPKQPSTRAAAPGQQTQKQPSARAAAPGQQTPKQPSTRQAAPGQQTPKQPSARAAAPGQQALKQPSARAAAPGQQAPKQLSAREAVPGQQTPKQPSARAAAPGQQTPKQPSARAAVPGQQAAKQAIQRESTPSQQSFEPASPEEGQQSQKGKSNKKAPSENRKDVDVTMIDL